MGREVRRVPPNWDHPKRGDRYIPLWPRRYIEERDEWLRELKEFFAGVHEDQSYYPGLDEYLTDHPIPRRADYMPDWPEQVCTHYQMYEDTTEGTPISPVFPTPEALARWLTDTGASAFADMTAEYEHWLRVARGGFAPSCVVRGGVLSSGVEG